MRISSIQNHYNNLLFVGRKNKKTYSPNETRPERTDFSYLMNELQEERMAKIYPTSPFGMPIFNIHSYIEPEEITEEKPSSFEETHGKFILDRYQKDAIDAYKDGKTVIVSAPTGIGKTLIAEYGIKNALDKNKRIVYTSPLKALSNEKYTEFCKLFGTYDENGNLIDSKNVGLMTGDTTINPDAPIVVMTTEIYRNSLLQGTEDKINEHYKDFDGVIFDEFHYLADDDRGTVWEEAVMNTPKHMKQMMLSATASNSKDILSWIGEINPSVQTHLTNVPESERYVPLREMVLVKNSRGEAVLKPAKSNRISLWRFGENFSERQQTAFNEMKKLLNIEDDKEAVNFVIGDCKEKKYNKKPYITANSLAEKLIKSGVDEEKAKSIALILSSKYLAQYEKDMDGKFLKTPKMTSLVNMLDKNKMTPALIYIFSKRQCNEELQGVAESGVTLLTPKESAMVKKEVEKALDKDVFLGADFTKDEYIALLKGYAVHHAGRLPSYKSLIEKLARKGLIKACFATETLIAGINMPFRTTVFTSLEKENDNEEVELISAQIFKQGAGRAGRRGKDEIGNVIVMPKNHDDYANYLHLSKTEDTSIKSKYDISYATILSDRVLNNLEEHVSKTLTSHQDSNKSDELRDKAFGKLKLLQRFGYIKLAKGGKYERTEKGDIAKNIFGINELFMSEFLYNPIYLKNCTKTELTAFAAAFADVKDVEPSNDMKGEYSYMNEFLDDAFSLAEEMDNYELYSIGDNKKTKYSTSLTPYVLEYASAPKSRKEALDKWKDIMYKMKIKDLIVHEGDFLRVVNGTIDILKLMAESSPDSYIRDEARKAISDLKKAPLTDIFNYELDIKEQDLETK